VLKNTFNHLAGGPRLCGHRSENLWGDLASKLSKSCSSGRSWLDLCDSNVHVFSQLQIILVKSLSCGFAYLGTDTTLKTKMSMEKPTIWRCISYWKRGILPMAYFSKNSNRYFSKQIDSYVFEDFKPSMAVFLWGCRNDTTQIFSSFRQSKLRPQSLHGKDTVRWHRLLRKRGDLLRFDWMV